MKIWGLILSVVLFSASYGQTNYRTFTSGSWTSPSTWQVQNPNGTGPWTAAVSTPDFNSNNVVILTGHTVTLSSNLTIDQTSIQTGGILTVDPAVVLTLNDSPVGYDLNVTGTLRMLGESYLDGAGGLLVTNSGIVEVGSLNPTGALLSGNTAGNIRNTTRFYASGSAISYNGSGAQFLGNGQSPIASVNLNNPNGVSMSNPSLATISLSTIRVNSGTFNIINNSINASALIVNGGNVVVNSSLASRSVTVTSLTLTNGNITLTGSTNAISLIVNGNTTLTNGNITLSNATAAGNLSFNGNLALTGGDVNISSTGAASNTLFVSGDITGSRFINSAGASTDITFSGTGALTNTYPLSAGSTVRTIKLSRSSSNLTISRALTLTNLTVTAGSVVTTVDLLMTGSINLASGTTFTFDNRIVEIKNGRFNDTLSGGLLSSNASSTLRITGIGLFGTLTFSPGNILGTLLLNRATSGTLVTLNSPLTIQTQLYLLAGSFANTSGLTLSPNALLSRNSAGSITGTAPAGGPYNLMYSGSSQTKGLEGSGSLATVTYNSSGTLTVSSAMTIGTALILNSGFWSNAGGFTTMANGSAIVRNNSATMTGLPPAGGPYNLEYNGTSFSTGPESRGSLIQLVNKLTGTLTLANSITTTGVFSNAAGTILMGANAVSAGSLSNVGSITAPTSTLTLTGNLTNAGTINPSTGTIIFNGSSIISGAGVHSFNHFTVNPGMSLTLPATMQIGGNLSIGLNATVINSGGTITFTGGGSPQTVSPNGITFFNVNVNKSGGSLTLTSPLSLVGKLTMLSATDFVSGGNLTLLSTNDQPAADASIATLPTGATVSGAVNVQRYFRIADNYDRFISSPVETATVAQIQASGVPVTGNFPETSYPCTGCTSTGGNLKWYDETRSGSLSLGYTVSPFTGESNSVVLKPAVGYELYMWNGVTPSTLTFTGRVNQGAIAFTNYQGNPLSHTVSTPAANASADGWNLVGNPYPSAIRWSTAGWSLTNIDPTVWVWDVVGRVWHSYNRATSIGDLTNGIIATGQGFWVYAPATGPAALSIDESAKSTLGNGSYFRERNELATAKITLTSGNYSDHVFLTVDDRATEAYDLGIDSPKPLLGNESLQIGIEENGKNFGHYGMGRYSMKEIPLTVYGESSGDYEMKFSNMEAITSLGTYYLNDSKLNQSVLITEGLNYVFSYDEKGTVQNRFSLSREAKGEEEIASGSVSVYPNPTYDKIAIDTHGLLIKSISLHATNGTELVLPVETRLLKNQVVEVDLGPYQQGIYLLKLVTDKGPVFRKIIKK